jgi:hypothetical protein
VRALQNFDDFAARAPACLDTRDPHDDAVAVHRLFGRFGRDEDIAGDALQGAIRNQEAVAVAVHGEASGGELTAAGGGYELP